MSKTPRTDAVNKAAIELPWGSAVVVPEGHPPSDPWALARELEIENTEMKLEIDRYKKSQAVLSATILDVQQLVA